MDSMYFWRFFFRQKDLFKMSNLSNTRPTLPQGWLLQDKKSIVDFIERRHFTEVYKLSDGDYLYLFHDSELKSKIRSRQIEHEKIIAAGKEAIGKRFQTHSNEEFAQRINRILSKSGLDAVAGMDELKQIIIRDIIHPFQHREKYKEYKLGIPNGILLFGPPGCGKTYIARKIGEELNIPTIELRESDVGSPYIHATSGNIAKAFKEALKLAPSIIFIDEISGLLPKRESLSGAQQYRESEINEFLVQIESAGSRDILVIGATNFPDRMDSAAMRSGRMDKRIFIPPPDYNARIELFKMELEDRPISFDVLPEVLSNMSEGYVASDIKLAVDNAARTALSKNTEINMMILMKALKETKPSLSKSELNQYLSYQNLERR